MSYQLCQIMFRWSLMINRLRVSDCKVHNWTKTCSGMMILQSSRLTTTNQNVLYLGMFSGPADTWLCMCVSEMAKDPYLVRIQCSRGGMRSGSTSWQDRADTPTATNAKLYHFQVIQLVLKSNKWRFIRHYYGNWPKGVKSLHAITNF